MAILILRNPDLVRPFISEVRRAADREREALGFLPKGVYEEAALQRKLLVASEAVNDEALYAGHLLFGGTYPNLRVFQIAVDPEFRKRGIATQLVTELVALAESAQYLSIGARVAPDLRAANSFWSRQGFKRVRIVRGGKAPAARIELVATVDAVYEGTIQRIWREYGECAAITKREFEAYYSGTKTAYAMLLRDFRCLSPAIELDDAREKFNGFHPPQFFKYLRAEGPELAVLQNRCGVALSDS